MLPGMIKTSGLDPDHEDDLTYVVATANRIKRDGNQWSIEVILDQDSWDVIGPTVTGLLDLTGVPFAVSPSAPSMRVVYLRLGTPPKED